MFIAAGLLACLGSACSVFRSWICWLRVCLPLAVIVCCCRSYPMLGHEVNGSTRWIDLGLLPLSRWSRAGQVAGDSFTSPATWRGGAELNRGHFVDTI